MKNLLKRLVITICLILSMETIQAQTPGEDGIESNPDTTEVPLDGGLSLLIAAGIGYGIKKAHDNRKKTVSGEVIEK